MPSRENRIAVEEPPQQRSLEQWTLEEPIPHLLRSASENEFPVRVPSVQQDA